MVNYNMMFTILHEYIPENLVPLALSAKTIQTSTLLEDFVELIDPDIVTIDAEDVNIGKLVDCLLIKNIRIKYVIYSGIETSDAEAPCGCYGYDGVCESHRTHEDLYCGCKPKLGLTCSYHK
jgi:hypothetical protein